MLAYTQDAASQTWSIAAGTGPNVFTWRAGKTAIGANASTSASALYLYNGLNSNSHLTLAGMGPGIKFNLYPETYPNVDNASIGLNSAANQYITPSNEGDFVMRNLFINADILFATTYGANATEKMRITALGRVGIGINPTAYLHVKSNDAGAIASFESSTTSNFVSKLNVVGSATSATDARTNIDSWGWNYGNSTATSGVLYLQSSSAGNVGIGNFFPSGNYLTANSKLHVQGGNIQINNSGAPALLTDVTKYGLTMGFNGNTTKAATDYSWIQSSNGPIILNPLSGNTLSGTQTNNYVAIGLPKSAIVGTVGNGYNLLVGGKILCEELKIKLNSGSTWYDHVLKPEYKLMTLDSLESFITENSHLPDIPSEAEVRENGIMAGEMNGLLLKKVEELTLYMIEQNKNISTQNIQNQMQAKAIADQAEQIKFLKEQNELLIQQMKLLMQK